MIYKADRNNQKGMLGRLLLNTLKMKPLPFIDIIGEMEGNIGNVAGKGSFSLVTRNPISNLKEDLN